MFNGLGYELPIFARLL